MSDKETYGTLTDAEIDEFDKKAREQFNETLRMSEALREAIKQQTPPEPQPGSDAAKELIRDAIKQGKE